MYLWIKVHEEGEMLMVGGLSCNGNLIGVIASFLGLFGNEIALTFEIQCQQRTVIEVIEDF